MTHDEPDGLAEEVVTTLYSKGLNSVMYDVISSYVNTGIVDSIILNTAKQLHKMLYTFKIFTVSTLPVNETQDNCIIYKQCNAIGNITVCTAV